MSYTQLYYHIIIRTKWSKKVIPNENSKKLYRYINGFVKNKKSKLFRINGMPDHIHLFVDLHPTISISEFIKTLKNSTHNWLDKNRDLFPDFENWGKRYCALTYSQKDKFMIINYIAKQREHHATETYEQEIIRILKENDFEIEENFWDEE